MGGRKEQTGHMLMHSMFHDSVLSNVLEDRFLFSQKTPCSHIYAINLTNIKEQRHLGNSQLYPCSISDKAIVEQSGLLRHLIAGILCWLTKDSSFRTFYLVMFQSVSHSS